MTVVTVSKFTVILFLSPMCNPQFRVLTVFLTFAVVPHVTDAIQEWVERVAKVPVDGDNREPQCCIIEVCGRTVLVFVNSGTPIQDHKGINTTPVLQPHAG